MQSSMLRKGMIVGMGNSMLDLIGHVSEDVLDKYKLVANNGYLAAEEHMPLFQELMEKYNAKFVVGGSVQNTFRVTQWVLSVPKVCTIFGGIGCDQEGKVLVSKAEADGVDTQYQYINGTPTGICAVLLTKNGAERTLVANLSAASCFTIDHLQKEENHNRLQVADVVYVAGFFLPVSVESVLYAAQCVYNRNTGTFAMNLSASYIAERYLTEWTRVMPYIDLLFGNETEARVFAKELKFEEVKDLHEIALELSHMPKLRPQQRIVVLTQGCDPVIVAKDGVTKEYPVIQLSPEKVIDTTGAGDAFVGGFLAQFIQNRPLEQCISCGIWCATQIVQQQGCSLEGFVKYEP
uniref:Adenosine kinase n=3 Tax=Homalodisca liturata TaxID=320908 RepID=A0A1B6HBV8_9HEMI